MQETKDSMLQWHPAFFAGIQIELAEDAANLTFESEHQLGTKPMQIDVLIIKKNTQTAVNHPFSVARLSDESCTYRPLFSPSFFIRGCLSFRPAHPVSFVIGSYLIFVCCPPPSRIGIPCLCRRFLFSSSIKAPPFLYKIKITVDFCLRIV